jgi:hypothetical protein
LTAKKKKKENAIESYHSEATEELYTYSEHVKTHVGTHNLRHHRKVGFFWWKSSNFALLSDPQFQIL